MEFEVSEDKYQIQVFGNRGRSERDKSEILMAKGGLFGGFSGVAGVIVDEIAGNNIRKAIAGGADLLEIRVDTLKEKNIEKISGSLEKIKKLTDLPILVTVRSPKEGGASSLSDAKRSQFYQALLPFADIIDIELSSGKILESVVNSAKRHRKKVIISYHNFRFTPGEKKLQEIIDKGRASGGDLIKIAAYAKGREDLKRLAGLLTRSKDLIIIAMGDYGAASRVFFPMLGSKITYGSVTSGTAPGQLPLKFIKEEFRRYGFVK